MPSISTSFRSQALISFAGRRLLGRFLGLAGTDSVRRFVDDHLHSEGPVMIRSLFLDKVVTRCAKSNTLREFKKGALKIPVK